jgi:Xaa-Pro aminopeptidase
VSDRAARVAGGALERGADVLLVSAAADLRWLTGFTGTSGLALVGGGGAAPVRVFLTDSRYVEQAAAELDPAWDRRCVTQDLLGPGIEDQLPAAGGTRPLRVGFDDRTVTVASLERVRSALPAGTELVPAAGLVAGLREVKDDAEVERIAAAAQLADAALGSVLERGLAGRTEADVALDLEVAMRRLGAQAIAFPPIVAAGAHGALPHAAPRRAEIPRGALVTIDWGAQLDGYCSDCTRTYAAAADPPGDARAVYDLVLRAQRAALGALRPGPTGRDVDAVARELIEDAGHGEHFGHGLGHGVGLEVHEGPRLSRLGEATLQPGMVVTVEPGVYVPGRFGVRIEDLCVITGDGSRTLTGRPTDLEVVG